MPTLEQWSDTWNTSSLTYIWSYSATSEGGDQTCDTWPMLSGRSRIVFGTYDKSDHHGRVYCADWYAREGYPHQGKTRWPDLDYERVETALDGTQQAFGQFLGNPCNDYGDTPNLFFPSADLGSGPGKAALLKIVDLSPDQDLANGYFHKKMTSDSDDINSTPIYANQGNGLNVIYFVSTTGKIFAVKPDGTVPSNWPISTGKTFQRQDLAIDTDGGVIVITTDGYIRAYHAAYPPTQEE